MAIPLQKAEEKMPYIQLLSLSTSIWGAWKMWKKWPVKHPWPTSVPHKIQKSHPQPRGRKLYTHTHTHTSHTVGRLNFTRLIEANIAPIAKDDLKRSRFLSSPGVLTTNGLEDAQQLQPTHLHRPSELPSYLVTSRANETSTTKCPTFTLKILVVQKKSAEEFLKECSMEYL